MKQINIIFHLAAQVEIEVGLKSPYITYETNVRGTYTLLEAAKLFPTTVEAIIVASSDKSYGEYSTDKMPYKDQIGIYNESQSFKELISKNINYLIDGL